MRLAAFCFLFAYLYFVARLDEVKPGEVFAEHDRAKNRSHRRFRRDAMVLSEVVDCLLRMIWSENRYPLFGIMRLYGMPRARSAPRERICFHLSPPNSGVPEFGKY